MITAILDASGNSQSIVVRGQEAVVDHSSTIQLAGSQIALNPNPLRSGWFFQNNSATAVWLNDTGVATSGAGSVQVAAGASISTMRDYPLTTNALNIIGSIGSAYTLKEW